MKGWGELSNCILLPPHSPHPSSTPCTPSPTIHPPDSLEELGEAIARAEDLQRSGHFPHVCLLMTEKDYARQTDLFDAVFRCVLLLGRQRCWALCGDWKVHESPHDSTVTTRLIGACSQQAASPISSSGEEGSSGFGAYVLQAGLQIVEHDRCGWAGAWGCWSAPALVALQWLPAACRPPAFEGV